MKSLAAGVVLLTSAPILSAVGEVVQVDCKYGVELLHLQDSSATFGDYKDEMVVQMSKLITVLGKKYDDSRFAFSSFTDKPMLGLGTGDHDSCGKNYAWDHCYNTILPMTKVEADVVKAIRETFISGGKDLREGQLEGLIRAAQDPSVGWGASSDTVELIKILVLVTDDEHHMSGEAQAEVEYWRSQYGDPNFCNFMMSDDSCMEPCVRAGELRPFVEAGIATDEELKEYDEIQDLIGPADPGNVLPHPGFGVSGDDDCITFDYPTTAQVAEVVDANDVKVIILHSGTRGEQQYRDLAAMFKSGVYMRMSEDASNVAALVDQAVAEILAKECYENAPSTTQIALETTPTPAPSTPTPAATTVAGSFQPITVPGYVRPTAPIAVVPTTVAGSFQPITVPGYVRPTAPIEAVPTTIPALVETTVPVVVLPPAGIPPADGGVSTGVIVGSAAAGAAVLAAGAAWFTGGFGLLGGAAPGAALAGANVEVPEVTVEREAAEAIDMDMFA